jgi:hypothetical protein
MDVDSRLDKILPSLIEMALNPRHSISVINVSSTENTINTNVLRKDGKITSFCLTKN